MNSCSRSLLFHFVVFRPIEMLLLLLLHSETVFQTKYLQFKSFKRIKSNSKRIFQPIFEAPEKYVWSKFVCIVHQMWKCSSLFLYWCFCFVLFEFSIGHISHLVKEHSTPSYIRHIFICFMVEASAITA